MRPRRRGSSDRAQLGEQAALLLPSDAAEAERWRVEGAAAGSG